MSKPFEAVEGQSFSSHTQWVCKASSWLTGRGGHPDYNNTEHGDRAGWRGPHFTALCFDQKGRRCRNGGDFARAEKENAFPVWWVWPDQIAPLLMAKHTESQIEERSDEVAAGKENSQPDTQEAIARTRP